MIKLTKHVVYDINVHSDQIQENLNLLNYVQLDTVTDTAVLCAGLYKMGSVNSTDINNNY